MSLAQPPDQSPLKHLKKYDIDHVEETEVVQKKSGSGGAPGWPLAHQRWIRNA